MRMEGKPRRAAPQPPTCYGRSVVALLPGFEGAPAEALMLKGFRGLQAEFGMVRVVWDALRSVRNP